MKTRIFVNGATGRMGQLAVNAINQDQELKLVGSAHRGDDLFKKIESTKPDVVVDFTSPEVGFENATTIIEAQCHPVIGTTGLTEEQIESLKLQCKNKKLGGLIAPNFSIAAVLMMQFSKQAAHFLPDVEIIELHHNGKKDAPSGTAIKTALMINETRKDKNEIPIHSVRLPGLLANQHVIFGSIGETLTIKHDTINRECFMPGLLVACKKVPELNELKYGLEHILEF